jgi:hypothetical protein
MLDSPLAAQVIRRECMAMLNCAKQFRRDANMYRSWALAEERPDRRHQYEEQAAKARHEAREYLHWAMRKADGV